MTSKVNDPNGGEAVYVMQVLWHKTASEAPANITMSVEDRRLVSKYIINICPGCDQYYRSDSLFVDTI